MSENYLGNPNLKRANVETAFTQEQINEAIDTIGGRKKRRK